jgi:RimJ/RimL family protein N-acetyltransferase
MTPQLGVGPRAENRYSCYHNVVLSLSTRDVAMILELERHSFSRVRPLFRGLQDHPVIDSVIDGYTPGRIAVDDADCPRAACLWNRMDAIMLSGMPSIDGFAQALRQLVYQDWIPDARRRQVPWFSWHYAPPSWSPRLVEIMFPARPTLVERRLYRWNHLALDWRTARPADATIHRLDQHLLARSDLENLDRVTGWILSFWHSVPDFARGIGSCVIVSDVIVSWCLSVFIGGRRVELGVETASGHRGRNYATLATAACVEACLARRLDPVWQCDRSNQASMAVAEKVGFRTKTDYTVFRSPLDQIADERAGLSGSD